VGPFLLLPELSWPKGWYADLFAHSILLHFG
jgi:hypothetical protein